jgi:hypothetical protein
MATVPGDDHDRPALRVAPDGFPAGHETPEGTACDLARAFIGRDVALFADTCIKPFTSGETGQQYAAFLEQVVESMRQEAARAQPSPGGPRVIGKVFAARRLSRNGPASYGYAVFGFQDVQFVDVGVFLHNGDRSLTRTLVIRDRDGRWFVHPLPASAPLLAHGLNQESASVTDFSEVYRITPV